MATITRTIPRKLQRRRNDVRTKSDNLKYNGINIEGIKQSLKVGQTIQITHTEREGSRGTFEQITENWIIERKYKHFVTCVRKVRHGELRQSFLYTDIHNAAVI